MTYKKTNYNILITGGSSGIGKSILRKFSSNTKNNVYYISRTKCKFVSNNVHHIKCDLTKESDLINSLNEIKKLKIDILINNAGTNKVKSFEEYTNEEINNLIELNLKVPIKLCQAVIKNMCDNNFGRIINIGSIWGSVSKTNRSIYSITKTGIIGLSRSLSVEYAKNNILVNTISPGFTNTELTKKTNTKQEINIIKNQIPISRLAETKEIAEITHFLCLKNNYITGQNFLIDGGYTSV